MLLLSLQLSAWVLSKNSQRRYWRYLNTGSILFLGTMHPGIWFEFSDLVSVFQTEEGFLFEKCNLELNGFFKDFFDAVLLLSELVWMKLCVYL